MALELDKQEQDGAIASLQRYFKTEFDRELGNLEADGLLRFFVKEIGPCLYNQAIKDAQSQLQTRVAELDIDCYEKPFSFWVKSGSRTR